MDELARVLAGTTMTVGRIDISLYSGMDNGYTNNITVVLCHLGGSDIFVDKIIKTA